MRKAVTSILILFAALAVPTPRSHATIIQLDDLYNNTPLVDQANAYLQGDATAGDLVQVIVAGNNGSIDAPNGSGLAGGDDQILLTLHVGVGQLGPNTGWVDTPLNYDSSLVGDKFYVRFWNGTTVGDSTYYGNSSLFVLLAGDAYHQAGFLDFAPDSSYPHQTDTPFSLLVIPEPSNLFLFGLIVWGILVWRKWRKSGMT